MVALPSIRNLSSTSSPRANSPANIGAPGMTPSPLPSPSLAGVASTNDSAASLSPASTDLDVLTKERDAILQQNAQLWRLVDKQRDTILSLQNQLQAAVSQNEATQQLCKDLQIQLQNAESAPADKPPRTPTSGSFMPRSNSGHPTVPAAPVTPSNGSKFDGLLQQSRSLHPSSPGASPARQKSLRARSIRSPRPEPGTPRPEPGTPRPEPGTPARAQRIGVPGSASSGSVYPSEPLTAPLPRAKSPMRGGGSAVESSRLSTTDSSKKGTDSSLSSSSGFVRLNDVTGSAPAALAGRRLRAKKSRNELSTLASARKLGQITSTDDGAGSLDKSPTKSLELGVLDRGELMSSHSDDGGAGMSMARRANAQNALGGRLRGDGDKQLDALASPVHLQHTPLTSQLMAWEENAMREHSEKASVDTSVASTTGAGSVATEALLDSNRAHTVAAVPGSSVLSTRSEFSGLGADEGYAVDDDEDDVASAGDEDEDNDSVYSEEYGTDSPIGLGVNTDTFSSTNPYDSFFDTSKRSESPGSTLSANLLPLIDIKVTRAQYRPFTKSKAQLSFIISIYRRLMDQAQSLEKLWSTEKTVAMMNEFHSRLTPMMGPTASYLSAFPESGLLASNVPSDISQRNSTVEAYLQSVLLAPLDEKPLQYLCMFLSSEVVPNDIEQQTRQFEAASGITKQGYMLRRGKNFGGWKPRYFVLDGPTLRFYEGPGGGQIGQIRLQQARLHCQTPNLDTSHGADSDVEFRHALMIAEVRGDGRKAASATTGNNVSQPMSGRDNSVNRHIFCAQTDDELKEWYDAMLPFTQMDLPPAPPPVPSKWERRKLFKTTKKDAADPADNSSVNSADEIQTFGYSDMRKRPSAQRLGSDTNASSTTNRISRTSPISGSPRATDISAVPDSATVPEQLRADSKLTSAIASATGAARRKGFWGFRTGGGNSGSSGADKLKTDNALLEAAANGFVLPSLESEAATRSTTIFGATLSESLRFVDPPSRVPSVVTRCLEFLDARHASGEEGIYRLSGSNSAIRSLKEAFNKDGDYDILAAERPYEVHAVAGLLKLFLREMPTMVLTRELYPHFLAVAEEYQQHETDGSLSVTGLDEHGMGQLRALVDALPTENYDMLSTVLAHLTTIVQNSARNKMNLRNVGIVFSPTLNMPTSIFTMLMTNYSEAFRREEAAEEAPTISIVSSLATYEKPPE